jgi:hypothetical protein
MSITDEKFKAFEDKQDTILEEVKTIKVILIGNGDPSKGVVVRLDRLEQREQARVWTIRAIAAGIITLIGRFLYDLFSK